MLTSPEVTTAEARSTAPPGRSASGVARLNWAANLAALSYTQPALAAALHKEEPTVPWTFGRDGSLTAIGTDGKWWRGCSVPLVAAEAMLASMDVQGRVACLLRPTLAAHVRVALRHCRPDQAIIALSPEAADLPVLLHCDDFSVDIRAHRLWFAWGADWADALEQLFADRPGFATPTQFIRLPTTPAELVDVLVSAAQPLFAAAAAARAAEAHRRRDQMRCPAPSARRRLCVVAPSRFRLWDDAGAVLADALRAQAGESADVVAFDADDPARSSALALLDAADGCHAVVAADTARADLPVVLPAEIPWITWATRSTSIPPADVAAPHDALIVVDTDLRHRALRLGWPAARVGVAGWPPIIPAGAAALGSAQRPVLAVIADTVPIVEPERLAEFSSHRLLWHHIATRLAADPFALREDAAAYLEDKMRRHAVGADGFDAALFLQHLILPAYAQGLARILLRAGLPLRLHGAGWDRIDEFRGAAAGPVASTSDLARIAREAAAVVDVWPAGAAAPLARLGRPVVRRGIATSVGAFCDAARRALPGGRHEAPPADPVSLQSFLSLLPA